jgi:hypothetical protein
MHWLQSSSTFPSGTASWLTCCKTGAFVQAINSLATTHCSTLPRSLGGEGAKTLMFLNVADTPESFGESLCSLRWRVTFNGMQVICNICVLRFGSRVNACDIGVARRNIKADDKKQEKWNAIAHNAWFKRSRKWFVCSGALGTSALFRPPLQWCGCSKRYWNGAREGQQEEDKEEYSMAFLYDIGNRIY